MRKFVYWLCAGVFGCLFGAIWSISWVDGTSTSDFPGKYQLSAARLFWSITPAIDINADADRALKLSWLKASTEINRKENKKISNIVTALSSEFYFVEQNVISNNKITSKKLN